jgi:ribose-phosphate pyrophosphokinase
MKNTKLISGSSIPALSAEIAKKLGIRLTRTRIARFSDGELDIQILENIRNKDVFLLQSTCVPDVNKHYMELFLLADAAKRASAKSITVVMPYYGYCRQDRKKFGRVPISARTMADLLTATGVKRILTIDLHAGQIQGFFNGPVDNIYASKAQLTNIRRKRLKNLVVYSPDAGGTDRARAFAKRLGAGLALGDKRREKKNQAEILHIIGNVKGKIVLMLDDMADTFGSMEESVKALLEQGAKKIYACVTHAVLSGPALARIEASPITELLVTNTIPLSPEAMAMEKIRSISIAGLLADAIRRIQNGGSVSGLFD